MRDENQCLALHLSGQPSEHQPLGLAVDRRRRLVQQQDAAGTKQSTGDGYALCLSLAQSRPLFAATGIQSVGKCPDKIRRSRVERGMTGDSAYLINGALIEQHARLIELHNPFFQKELTQWEKQVFTTGKPEQRPVYYGVPVTVPTPVAHQLLVSTHILKHLLNAGIGLRQLCDAAVLLRAQYEILDKKELEERCRRLGVYRWSQLLYALLVKYIGLPERYLPFPTDENPDTLMEEVWESGNFGFYDERKAARPEGKWKNKWYTVKQIGRKAKLFYLYAPGETFWWPVLLSGVRIKELIQGK